MLFLLTTLFVPDASYPSIKNVSDEIKYGVIVDCGSSGSRAHIFKWKPEQGLKQIELVKDKPGGDALSLHITPGLSSFKDDPDKASDYMEPIMRFISDTIPQDKHLDTPIYFMATAGMRLLDDPVRKRILADITRDLRLKFSFPRIKTQVISGALEGVYSWLSLNRRLGEKASLKQSYGMLEMGGASAQVTFELDDELELKILRSLKDDKARLAFKTEQVHINAGSEKPLRLFATTFLGLGVNSAREASVDLLVKDYLYEANETGFEFSKKKQFENHLIDPCLTKGSSEILSRPVELLIKTNQTVGFVAKPGGETFTVRVEGSGNFLGCITLLDRTLQIMKNERLNCPSHGRSCPIALLGNEFIPFESFPFIGLSEFFFTTNEMMASAGLFNRSRILRETQRICSTDYNKLQDVYSSSGVSQKDRILYECFKASWLLTILHESGFKMPIEYGDFRTVDRLNGEEIDWTIGAMLSEVALNNGATASIF